MLALILLWLHLPRAWRSALFAFASLLRSASGFSVSISLNWNHASPHCCWTPSQCDSCAIAEHQLRNLRPTDCCRSFRSMSVCDLRHTCRSAGLASEGTKNQLINRLCTHHGADRPTTNPPDPPSVTSAAVISANLQAEIQRAVSTAIADLAPALRSMEPWTPPGNPGTSQSDSDLTIVATPPPGPAPWGLESYPSARRSPSLPVSTTASSEVSSLSLTTFFLTSWATPYVTPLRLYQRPRASPSANRPHAATNATSMISLPGWKLGQRTAAWYFPPLLTAARNCSPTRQLSPPPLGSFIRKRGFRTTANFVEPQQAARHCGGIPLTLLSGS